jgi:HD domain
LRRIGSGQEAPVLIVVAALLVVLPSVLLTAARGLSDPTLLVVFVGLVAVGEVLQVRLPGDLRIAAPVSFAAGLALAIWIVSPSNPEPTPAHEVVTIYFIGQVVGGLAQGLGHRRPDLATMASRLLGVAAAAGLSLFLHQVDNGQPLSVGAFWWAVLHVGVAFIGSVAMMLACVIVADRSSVSIRNRVIDELRYSIVVVSAVISTAVLVAIGRWDLGLWSVPVFMLPLMLTVVSLRQFAIIRQTQRQTIQALSRATELAGYTEPGHAARVAGLSTMIGGDLGLPVRRLRRLESAALMHDVGQLSLPDPIPAGATVLATVAQQVDIARRGADVIRRTGAMDQVADVVELSAVPLAAINRGHHDDGGALAVSGPGGTPPVDITLEAGIVRVSNAFDDLVGSEPTYQRQQMALQQIRTGVYTSYDPEVIDSLERILSQSGDTPTRRHSSA